MVLGRTSGRLKVRIRHTMTPTHLVLLALFLGPAPSREGSSGRSDPMLDLGAVVRGPRDAKRLALVFTADLYAEGANSILDTLRDRESSAVRSS